MNDRKAQGIRFIVIGVAALTYALAVGYGDVMFLSVVSHAFPSGFLAGLAIAGALATAASALLLPLALHFWLAPGTQFLVGIGYWVADILVLALNSILAYGLATGATDPWLLTWQELSPATPLLAVLGWGLIFLFDQSHALRHARLGLEADLAEAHAAQLADASRGADVQDIIREGAQAAARDYAHHLTGVRLTAQASPAALPAQAHPVLLHSTNGHKPPVAPPETPAGKA